jgi:alcohol dehydrogenase (cytochrome c)
MLSVNRDRRAPEEYPSPSSDQRSSSEERPKPDKRLSSSGRPSSSTPSADSLLEQAGHPPSVSSRVTRMRLLTRIMLAVALIGVILAIVLIVPGTRWRGVIFARELTGHLRDVGLSDLFDLERPDGGFQLHRLAASGNPYASVDNPATSPADRTRGKELFAEHCAVCHGAAAAGGAAPNLATGRLRHGDSDWAIYRTITRGVPGTAMRGGLLPRPDVWRVMSYLHELQASSAAVTTAAAMSLGAAEDTTAAQLLDSSTPQASWRLPWGSYDGQRFSRDAQLNVGNVARLTVQWVHQFVAPPTPNESAPIVVGNYLYVTVPPATVIALDARSGAQIWQYQRRMPEDLRLCCLSANRGVAVLGRRIYLATLDAHLVALDASTGVVLWDRQIADYTQGYSLTSAPLPVGDKVIVGIAGGDFGIRGFIAAFDAAGGEPRWRFNTVAGPGEPGHESWSGDSWKTGGAAPWGIGSYDPELGLLYWGTGNPAPVYNRSMRAGDNLYSNCVLALEAASGKLVWHFQFSPADTHDRDSIQTPALIELRQSDNSVAKLLAVANRNGFFYVLDRRTGRFIRAASYARQTWATGLSATGRPLLAPDSEPTPQGVYVYPSVSGATNWWPSAYSPKTQLYYANVLEAGGLFFASERPEAIEVGEMYRSGSARTLEAEPGVSYVRAIDPVTARVRWEHRDASQSGAPRGGLLATAGGLLFGSDGEHLFALDAASGKELWSFATGGQISAPPVSYRLGDTQIVAVVAGQALFTFRLPAPQG